MTAQPGKLAATAERTQSRTRSSRADQVVATCVSQTWQRIHLGQNGDAEETRTARAR